MKKESKSPKAFQTYNDLMHGMSDLLHDLQRLLGHLERQEMEEMGNCRPDNTGVPVNIWIDETEMYKKGKLGKHIKFQINRKVRIQPDNACPMTLDGKIPEKAWKKAQKRKEFSLTPDEIDSIRNFVVNNAYALDKVADQLMWLDEFWNIRIRGGGKATDEEIQELKNKTDEYVKKHENDK